MAEEEKQEAAAVAAPAPSGGGNKLVLILTAVNVICTLGVAAIVMMNFQRSTTQPSVEDIVVHEESGGGKGEGKEGDAKKKKHKGAQEFGKMLTLDQFTVNLSTVGTVNPKFARVNIALQIESGDTEIEVTQKMPQVKNTIIDLFNSKRPVDLSTPEGRNILKDEIKNALNGFLLTGKVNGVYFTNFALSS